MIVALLGTGPDSFDRLVRPLDELAQKHGWEIFIQLGHTRYTPQHCRFERFVERERLLRMLSTAELVVTQGGYGGIRDALQFGKPIVAVPREPARHESPDCQEELVRAMEERGYLIGIYDIGDLERAIVRARSFVPATRKESMIPELLTAYVNGLCFR